MNSQSEEELKSEAEKRQADLQQIADSAWPSDENAKLYLEEAQRLYAEEEERRRIADSKATTYLLAVAALMSILTYLEGAVWGEKLGPAPPWLAFMILALAIAYTLMFAVWVLRTLKLAKYFRLGPVEIVDLASDNNNHIRRLIRLYLENARKNSETNNKRLTSLLMAHEYILRIFFAFGMLVLVEAAFGICKFSLGTTVISTDAPPVNHCLNINSDGKMALQMDPASNNTISLHLSPNFNAELIKVLKTSIDASLNLKVAQGTPSTKIKRSNSSNRNTPICSCRETKHEAAATNSMQNEQIQRNDK